MRAKLHAYVILGLVFGITLSGCGPGKLFGPTFTPTQTSTLTPTSTSTPTKTPTTTFTLTLTPTITLTPTLTFTPTPIYPPINYFVGTWRNIDPYTKSWPKIEIKILVDIILFVHFTGICVPLRCPQGGCFSSVWCEGGPSSGAIYEGNPVILFTNTYGQDSILILDGDTLHVTTFIHYTDGLGMKDKIIKDDYRK